MPSLTGSSNSCWHGTFESRRIWSISSSTRARSGSRALFCCLPVTVRKTSPTECNVARNAGGDDRHNAPTGQLLHEQIQKARIHQVQRRTSDQYFSPECCLARVIGNFRPTSGTSCAIQCGLEEGGGGRESVSEKTCLAEGGRLCMWLRNVTNFQISCSLKTFFQPGMALQRIPCCKI